jgi:hypothetical protein
MAKKAAFTIIAAHVPCGDLLPFIKLSDYEDRDRFIYVTHDCLPDGLPYNVKIDFVKKIFPPILPVIDSSAKNVDEILHELFTKDYSDVVYVCGPADSEDGERLIRNNGKKFNDKIDKFYYDFESIEVETDPSFDEQADESARLSVYADEGDLRSFLDACSIEDEGFANDLYDALRSSKGLVLGVSATKPEYRTINDLTRERATLEAPLNEERPLGLQDRMKTIDIEVPDRMSDVEEWIKESKTNPFVKG